MQKIPVEYEEVTTFKNVVLPTNYYFIDKKTDFTSTTKVSQICEDLKNAVVSNDTKCGLIQINNGVDYVGFYYCHSKYVSITLGTYGSTIRLIGLMNDNPYTYTINGA